MSYVKAYWKQKDYEIFGTGSTPDWNQKILIQKAVISSNLSFLFLLLEFVKVQTI